MRDKYVIAKYLRLSAEDGDKIESDSIVNQRCLIDFFIKEKFKDKNADVIEFVDDGYTGTDMNRPGMKKLLILAETKEINCVIVKDFSRFARDYVEVGMYAEQKFPDWQIRFISVNDGYDSIDFRGITGGIDIAMKNIAYTMYSRDLSEKIKSARRIQYKQGKYIATYAFYGYKKSPDDKHKLIVDEPAAEIVKRIFNMRIGGMKPTQIAITLNKEGILTPSGYKRSIDPKSRKWNKVSDYDYWTNDTIHRILDDERYTGKLIIGKTESVTCGNKKVRRKRSDIVIVENTHEAIVPQYIFDEAQQMKSSATHPKQTDISLSGLIRCGGCGHIMYRHNKAGKIIKYSCDYKKFAEPNNCFKGSISENDLVDFLSKLIRNELEKTVDVEKAKERIADACKEKEKEINRLYKKIDEQKKKKLAEYIKLTKGQVTEEEFISVKEKLDVEITELEKSVSNMNFRTAADKVFSISSLFSDYIGKGEINRKVIQDLVKTVYVYEDKRIEIVWNFNEKIF